MIITCSRSAAPISIPAVGIQMASVQGGDACCREEASGPGDTASTGLCPDLPTVPGASWMLPAKLGS